MFVEIASAAAVNVPEIVVFCVSALVVLGHNLWLVAERDADETKIEVVTGDVFPESDSAVRPERIKSFRVFARNDSYEITNFRTVKNSLIADLKSAEKIKLVALELRPHPIVLEARKFAGYVASEAAEKRVAPDFVAGETETAQRESYAKFAKVLIDNRAFGETIGQKLEIVFESNPAELESGEKLKIKVLFDGEPFEGLRVSIGAANLHGGKYAAHAFTNENGAARIEISGNGLWFVRTHLIRPHADSDEYDWESFWASTTFRV